jgi:hypothetical protein
LSRGAGAWPVGRIGVLGARRPGRARVEGALAARGRSGLGGKAGRGREEEWGPREREEGEERMVATAGYLGRAGGRGEGFDGPLVGLRVRFFSFSFFPFLF